ncbi:hypothetical protein LBMAG46_23100 [Planctomycetia bacterium]|nr:hypothetical protein LBMAG46_23100 [Planctomycetia bacterium]
MKSADRTFAGEDETGQDRGIAEAAGEQLVHADRGLNIPAALWADAGKYSGRAFGVTADHVFRVMQSVDEIDFVLERFQGGEGGAQFKLTIAAFGPPFGRMNAIAEKEEGEAFCRLFDRFDSQQPSRFQPWQGDRGRCGLEDNAS